MLKRIFKVLQVYKERPAIVSKDNIITYKEIYQVASKFDHLFTEKNLIFHICTNTIGSIAGYVALINSGQTVAMIDDAISKSSLGKLMNTYLPEYICMSADMYDEFGEYKAVVKIYDYIMVKTNYNASCCIDEDLVLLLSTSGSLSDNKYVRIAYKNMMSNANAIIEYLKITQSDRTITTLPMSYTYGLSIINSYLLAGATIVVTDYKLYQKEFWELVRSQNVTSISGVPYMYEMLEKFGFMNMAIPSLKTLTQAGGKLSIELQKKYAEYSQRNGIDFYIMYGQTEATARMAYLPCEKIKIKLGSIGIPIPGGKIILENEKGEEIIEAEVEGEIVYYGDNVSLGYANCRNDLQKNDENMGKLYTGDIAIKDEDGYLYIKGRKKRFVKLYGKRISLDRLENILSEMYKTEIYCIGNDNKIVVNVLRRHDLSETEMRDWITKHLNVAKDSVIVKTMYEVPRNSAGKVLYSKL